MLSEIPKGDFEPVLADADLPAPCKKSSLSTLSRLLQGLSMIALAVASYFVISHFFVQSVTVVGMSMVPTLADSENYLLNRWVYYVHPPKQNDVVVLRDPGDNGFSVKRVIAVSGDSIYMKNGFVYVNGKKLEEPYLKPNTHTFANSYSKDQLIICGKNEFYVLGDNRMNSVDSRCYGPVPRRNILGLVVR